MVVVGVGEERCLMGFWVNVLERVKKDKAVGRKKKVERL